MLTLLISQDDWFVYRIPARCHRLSRYIHVWYGRYLFVDITPRALVDLGVTSTPIDWLQLELLRNVYDSELQRKLLEVREPKLEKLIKIATLWQQADSAQVAMGKEALEDVLRVPTQQDTQDTKPPQEDEDRCLDDVNVKANRMSDYKKEGKLKWNNQQSNIRPPARQSPPNQCGGCGAQGEKMQPRDACPARSLVQGVSY